MSDNQSKPLTHEQFNQLRNYQYSGCALCGRVTTNLELDHDHRTNLIRGLLCRDCNRMLDEYEKKRRIYQNFEGYLQDPPMKALGLNVQYRPASNIKEKAS